MLFQQPKRVLTLNSNFVEVENKFGTSNNSNKQQQTKWLQVYTGQHALQTITEIILNSTGLTKVKDRIGFITGFKDKSEMEFPAFSQIQD